MEFMDLNSHVNDMEVNLNSNEIKAFKFSIKFIELLKLSLTLAWAWTSGELALYGESSIERQSP